MAFAENFKRLRRLTGISQERLAESLGISRQAISKWETGVSQPDTKNLVQLANIFSVSLDELVGNTQRENAESKNTKPSTLSQTDRPYVPRPVAFAYVMVFSSIVGMCSYVNTPFMLWLGMGLVGGIALVFKQQYVTDASKRQGIILLDIAAILVGILLGNVVPDYFGLLKQAAIAVPASLYVVFVCKRWFLVGNTRGV